MLTSEQFIKNLRDALNHLYEPQRLRQSPLAALFGVANRHDTPSALRRILVEAIESLEPKGNEPLESQAWEIYEPLFYRYVEQLSQTDVADQMSMSVRNLRRKEHAALEALANLLWERYGLDVVSSERVTTDAGGDIPAIDQEAIACFPSDEDLAWVKEAPQEGPANLEHAVRGVLDLAQGLARQHGVQLESTVADDLPGLAGDPVAVRHILLNLLSVAIPRASGGRLIFSVKPQRWEVGFRVQCPQYPSGRKPTLDDEAANLNMAEQLATLCGGHLSLSVDARAFDATLTLPALEQLPVLVIDDNADTLQLLQRYTVGTRYRLTVTRDPQEALRLAKEICPQAIVLDVMMPRVDGWEVLGQLRQHPLTRHIPIVVCTILRQKEIADFLGASGFIQKPVTRQAFLDALDRQVELAVESR